jgi:hypothetical protein
LAEILEDSSWRILLATDSFFRSFPQNNQVSFGLPMNDKSIKSASGRTPQSNLKASSKDQSGAGKLKIGDNGTY